MTHNDNILSFFNKIPHKYVALIAADFAEEVLPIYEAYNPDSSVLKAAIAAARGTDKAIAKAAANAAAKAAHAVIRVAYATNAAYAAYAAASAAAIAETAYVAYATYAADNAVAAAKRRGMMKLRQVEIIKGWIVKMNAEDPVLMAFYDTVDFK